MNCKKKKKSDYSVIELFSLNIAKLFHQKQLGTHCTGKTENGPKISLSEKTQVFWEFGLLKL